VKARLNYLEIPVRDIATSQAFFATIFGEPMTSYGPDYFATQGREVDIGLQSDPAEASAAPLPIFQVDDLEAALALAKEAGGVVTRPIFAFPGGQRFHVREPSGNELAFWTPLEE
jgi:uncharacterized protein